MFQLHPQLENDTILLGAMPLSQLLLMNDAHYPWFILVPRYSDAKELIDLSATDQQQYLIESNTLSNMLKAVFCAEKLNIAALGNMVPQLHIHHIARFSNDKTWPKPVWGAYAAKPYTKSAQQKTIELIKSFAYDVAIDWAV